MTNAGEVAEPSGLRERKKFETRQALSETALDLALERGWHGFTVADVTDAVGVSRRTFSNYFAGKAECVAAVSGAWVDEVIDSVRDAPAGLPLDVVLQDALIKVSAEAPDRWERYIRVVSADPELEAIANRLDKALIRRVADLIANRLRAGLEATVDTARSDGDEVGADPRVELLAMFCVNAGRLCLQRWLARPPPRNTGALTEQLRTAFLLIDLRALTG